MNCLYFFCRSSFFLSSFALFSCDLLTTFSVVFDRFLFLCIYWDFWFVVTIKFWYSSFCFVLFCLLFRAMPMAYGGSQARGPIGATAASLCHSNIRLELCLQPTLQLTETQDPYPLRKARDQTLNLNVPSWIHFWCDMTGTPSISSLDTIFVCRWFSTFTVYMPLLVSLVICVIFVSSYGLFFSSLRNFFSICGKAGLMLLNSLSFSLSVKVWYLLQI